ncbi:LEF-10 [Urbanus proteus nucleopolyhedrovirus]|uniref:LEF-10 n=1 Tax=Urbanus proteus nucleopolyhedrovirus TaxID=1675866 RepID=A0A1W6AYJ4_9ABAC|nr:LEF-10 [Urbanus proteus nucleopolyhedrovirus]ARJ36573.1 LEF-10 [Urbanus proteus nucleopolyhedrovirus]
MSEASSESNVLSVIDIILKNNLDILNDTYIVLNVLKKESGGFKPMCIGEISAFKTFDFETEKSMSNSFTSSELSSNTSS